MDRLIHSTLSAMRGAMARQATTANNLANTNTTGFRGEIAEFRPLWLQGAGVGGRAMASEEVLSADMNMGVVVATGRDLDMALGKDSMIAVQSDEGEEAYTRRGDLTLSETGILTTGDGTPVLGEGGPITLPPADKMQIDKQGSVWILPAGADPAQGMQEVDRIRIVSTTGSPVVKGVDGLFRVRGGGVLPSDPDAQVTPGSLEGSNVNASQALIDMIEASRSWETQIKMLTTAQELDQSSATLMRLE
jgi:flagellar basal-body rod protein FlgF